jgi:hypothetical protein
MILIAPKSRISGNIAAGDMESCSREFSNPSILNLLSYTLHPEKALVKPCYFVLRPSRKASLQILLRIMLYLW